MMFLILDSNPCLSALKIPDKLKFKQLLELAQMVSSITGSVYKAVKQGKAIREWIISNSANKEYTLAYYATLYNWCFFRTNLKEKTKQDLMKIYLSLLDKDVPEDLSKHKIDTCIFRYQKDYKGSSYPTNSELPVDTAIKEYTQYLQWKETK